MTRVLFPRRHLIRDNILGGGSIVLAYDTFTDTNGTNLTSHTMNVGGGWTINNDNSHTYQIDTALGNPLPSLKFSQNSQPLTPVITTTTATHADVTISADVYFDSGGTNASSDAGPCARFQDASNYTFASVGQPSTFNGFAIYEQIAGVFNQRAFVANSPTTNTWYTIVLNVVGTKAVAMVNGGNRISYSSLSVNTSGTKHGVRLGGGNANSLFHVDNFRVTYP